MKILSNDKISTGLGDILYFLYNIVSSNPKIFPMLSSKTKPIIAGVFIPIKDPRVLKFGLIKNG